LREDREVFLSLPFKFRPGHVAPFIHREATVPGRIVRGKKMAPGKIDGFRLCGDGEDRCEKVRAGTDGCVRHRKRTP
jgi:hypothetical protein